MYNFITFFRQYIYKEPIFVHGTKCEECIKIAETIHLEAEELISELKEVYFEKSHKIHKKHIT